MGEFDELAKAIRMEIARNTPVQTFWAKAETVKDTTMTAVRLDDAEARYYNVQLGLGAVIQKPMPNSRVLLGIIDNKKTACFLIYAEEVSEITLRGGNLGGLVVADKVTARLVEHENKVNALIDYLKVLPVPVSGAVSGPPVPAPYAAFRLTQSQSANLQNTAIKHG